ncbi:7940_t:CDS:1 [Scutellospora calospora]|uniref:7940_t:CDS:1 n=1 Tax=Scutellospora calospora TaxID=85575 RepID=A0ACA9NJ51_9GLOM|nr:7940_t:CDS:1 [Scutellospora calospora]
MGFETLEKIDQELIDNSEKYHGLSKSDIRYQECLTILHFLGKYSGCIPEHGGRIILQMFKFPNNSIRYRLLLNHVLKTIKSDEFCLNETGENNDEVFERRVGTLQDILEFIDYIQKPFKLLSINDIPKFIKVNQSMINDPWIKIYNMCQTDEEKDRLFQESYLELKIALSLARLRKNFFYKITNEDEEKIHQISYFEFKMKDHLGLVFQNINYDDSKVKNSYKNMTTDYILNIIINSDYRFEIGKEECYSNCDVLIQHVFKDLNNSCDVILDKYFEKNKINILSPDSVKTLLYSLGYIENDTK